jgi:cytochrome b pre-mRNA-processing protein 3
MIIPRLFGNDPLTAAGQRLYVAAVAQARRPGFYADCQVPDTVDGRFEMIALHVFLLLHRLKDETEADARPLARALSEALFADMDRSLREMGAGDLGVGKRVQAMAEGFYGRVAAYEAGLGGQARLEDAIRRNVHGTIAPPGPESTAVAAIAAYMQSARKALEACAFAALRDGQPAWPSLTVRQGPPTYRSDGAS